MPKLNVVFMGTPDFAVPSLKKLIEIGVDISAVYTQPPRPAGRGHKIQLSPVHLFCLEHGLKVLTPFTLKDEHVQREFQHHQSDVAVVAAYGLILPTAILAMPKKGCVNIHGSLLPRWRGAAPIQRAILAGDPTTGITMMQMNEGLDTGNILLKKSVPITGDTTASDLYQQLANLGADYLEQTLQGVQEETIVGYPQPQQGVTYADKLKKEEAALDWRKPAQQLERQIRAFNLWPGSFFEYQGQKIKVIKASWEPLSKTTCGTPHSGQVLDSALLIACGCDALRLIEVQKPGKASCHVQEFLNGMPIAVGTQLSHPNAPV